MLNITSPFQPVEMPSDFKIAITGIVDSEGKPQVIADAEFYFEFYVSGCGPYIVSNTQNSLIENGELFFIFQDYPFRVSGKLKYRQLTKVPDTAFSGGMQDVWTEGETSIILK